MGVGFFEALHQASPREEEEDIDLLSEFRCDYGGVFTQYESL